MTSFVTDDLLSIGLTTVALRHINAIFFWGTPVLLITSKIEDGTENISAVSSNIIRTGQCVVNLPDDTMTHHVNLLAGTTGTEHPSTSKLDRGYRYVKDKWTRAQLTTQKSNLVRPSRILECLVQMECELAEKHETMKDYPDLRGAIAAIERKEFYGSSASNMTLSNSRLGKIEEEKYRPFTRSQFVALPGDGDKEEVEKHYWQANEKIENEN
ncbi:hypothetical protein MKX08_006001 [Trichoderma sp. CBMAI-0020]|nr:hypothetical protein MKX08_006001 [Trichoderma sp. CBMAI-0020]